MSKVAAALNALVEQLESYEARLDALTAQVNALEARLVSTTAGDAAVGGAPIGVTLVRDEPTIALAEYRRQLADVAFHPEGDGVTSAMRAEHRAAVDAADRAASWIEQSGDHRAKEIYAAIGAGRKALIRLAAMREHRPVPIPLLTTDELSGYVDATADVHTEDRFRWQGTGDAEFLLDRPEYGKPVFVEVIPDGPVDELMHITKVQRTDRKVDDVEVDILYDEETVYRAMVAPNITHLRVTGPQPWHARVLPLDELPPMDERTTGRGQAYFRHTLGARTVTIQGTVGGYVYFVPDCDCTDTCEAYKHLTFQPVGSSHHGDFREDVTLPAGSGLLYLQMRPESVWSVTVLGD